ncbi:MAG: hypothetical protein ACFE9Q_13665 [Candidatus Hodarchaeota archaeon]
MKKSKYGLIGSVLILAMILGQITYVRGTTYTCTGVVDAEAVWKVKTVHAGALNDIFGLTWLTTIELTFGTGASVVNARMKTKVVSVNSSSQYNPGIGLIDVCEIKIDWWYWTTEPFGVAPNMTNFPSYIFMHPENLTTYCIFLGVAIPAFAGNVSERNAAPYLNAIPVPAATFLSELLWDSDYEIQGTTVTHTVTPVYLGWYGNYLVECVETWRYSSQYGTFLGYKLVHNNGTTAYETVLETAAPAIPGFELSIVIGASMGIIISLIFIVMKKKR